MDTDVENGFVNKQGEGQSGTNEESSIDIYIYSTLCKIPSW